MHSAAELSFTTRPACSVVLCWLLSQPLLIPHLFRDTESNSAIDLSQLLPEDKAKLASHLTEEQREWLRRAGEREGDAGWLRRTEEELRRVVQGEDGREGGMRSDSERES